MEHFKPASISSSGRPNLVEGEVELLIQDSVGLYQGKNRTNYRDGTAYLTSHHIFWIGKQGALALEHKDVATVLPF
jgi:ESCRT-II complex subunit VPS36